MGGGNIEDFGPNNRVPEFNLLLTYF